MFKATRFLSFLNLFLGNSVLNFLVYKLKTRSYENAKNLLKLVALNFVFYSVDLWRYFVRWTKIKT